MGGECPLYLLMIKMLQLTRNAVYAENKAIHYGVSGQLINADKEDADYLVSHDMALLIENKVDKNDTKIKTDNGTKRKRRISKRSKAVLKN